MLETTHRCVDMFWELIEGTLNAVLVVLCHGGTVVFVCCQHVTGRCRCCYRAAACPAADNGGLVVLSDRSVRLPARPWLVLT